MKHQTSRLVNIGQSLIGSIGHTLQASPVIALYAIIFPNPGISTPLPAATMSPHGAATALPGADESYEEIYESLSENKLGGAVERPAGDWA